MTRRFLLLAVLAALACSSNETVTVEAPPPGAALLETQPLMTDLVASSYTGVSDRRRIMVQDATAWNALWAEITANVQPTPSVPAVDFENETVIFVSMGARNSGGYGIEIPTVHAADGKLYVAVHERSPGSNCVVTGALTAPLRAVRVAGRYSAIVFNERTSVSSC